MAGSGSVDYPFPFWFIYNNGLTEEMLGCKPVSPSKDEPCKKTQKENTMAYANSTAAITVAAAPVDEAKRYLADRLRSIWYDKRVVVGEIFKPLIPKSGKEALKWLKDGNYHLDQRTLKDIEEEDDEDEDRLFDNYAFLHAFNWGKTPLDHKARDKAYADLDVAYTKAKDVVEVVTDETARLAALREFEEYKVQ